jgi:hypothetical protein
MKQLILLSLLVLVACTIIACKTNKQNTSSKDKAGGSVENSLDTGNIISMSKGACYGTCPIYTMTIYKNGVIHFFGKRFCAMIGPRVAQLSNEQIEDLTQDISDIKFETFPDKFESMIADLPSTELTFYRADSSAKSIWWNMNEPEQLLNLSTKLDSYRSTLDWKIDKDAPLPKGAIGHQITTYLNDGIDAYDFAKEFSAYDLVPKKEIQAGQNYWLFEFDTDKITPYEMMDLLIRSDKTQDTRFNTKVSER